MARILVFETDARQASLVKAIVLNRVGAQLETVRSKEQAIAAIDADVPDLILLSALISPRDEEEIVAHLRTLDRADHLQTLTIPRIASSSDDDGSDGGLLRKFKRRRGARPRAAGCEPKVFADEILGYLERAEQIKADRAAVAEAKRLAAEAERRRATSRIQESPAPTAAPIDVAPAAVEMPVAAAPAPETQWIVSDVVEALSPEIEVTAPAVVDTPLVDEPVPEPAVVEALSSEAEMTAPAAIEAPLIAEPIPDPTVVDTPLVAESMPELPAIEASTEVQSVAALKHEETAPDAPGAKAQVEIPAVAGTPVAAAPAEPPPAPPHAPPLARPAPLESWQRPDLAPIGSLPEGDQTPVTEDLRVLLHGLRLPTSLADLARAGGCRIHRVRVAQLRGPATISDRQGDADDLTFESHDTWLDGRRGTPVAPSSPRTPTGSR